MGKRDPRIDAYIAKSADYAAPILQHLRELIHSACPDVEETIKWQFPHFTFHGVLCGMAAFKQHCALNFWHKDVRDSIATSKPKTAMGQLGRITSLSDLPSNAILTRHIKQAMKLNASGIKSPRAKRAPASPVRVPSQIKAELKKHPKAQATFDALSNSHRKEYIEWITQAKQKETIARRMTKMISWLKEGKSLNWKYERK